MTENFDAVIASPVGFLGLQETAGVLTRIEFLGPQAVARAPQSALLQETGRQLAAWFADPAFEFSLPYRLEGTEFRRKVWLQIAAIPCGEVKTYTEIANALDSAPRPVGGACGANPLPLVIPCHRVVAAQGLGGFNAKRGGQDWLPIKRWLLDHERSC
ncbi:methylated-DNA-[protein]-cysteine S-methyltransferase [Formivibrio citricus]|uniref:Methylated-DNA-[protein]-cysteine S-methyltransferase n=1 Tax=Formivibrio citricus TaxID=83765 RepID=A0A1I4ZQ51_9NEIS|nr:methylated-DNA--[protein]-cysteine S-methyltransferase [Formivibrio citricus]SFN52404.1 methylated-DNA-[protein]-cysteine S-methyltransferase [Formivibrio citricus]